MDSKEKKFIQTLEFMKGRTYSYANQIHYIKDTKVDQEGEKCTIITNLNTYTRKFESMPEFLKYWEQANEPAATAPAVTTPETQMQVYVEQEHALADELITMLKDNITKVQTDPNYLKQATVVNNNVNSIINVVKLKLDFTKQMRKRS